VNEKEFYIYLGTRLKDRIRFRFEKNKGQILDLVLQYETIIDKKWVAKVRYDCAHGFFHRDLLHPIGDKEKIVIDIPDLEDKWEWYKEQYLKKLKNDK
jgi:hypothetical protein